MSLCVVHNGYGSKWLCQAAHLESGMLVLLHVKFPFSSAHGGASSSYSYGSKWLCQAARLESGVLVLLHVKSPYASASYGNTLPCLTACCVRQAVRYEDYY